MPDLSYLDLYEHDGHLHQQTGSMPMEELLKQLERDVRQSNEQVARASEMAAQVAHSIRAFTRATHQSRHGEPLSKLASLQSATMRVLQSLLPSYRARSTELEVLDLCVAWDPSRHTMRRLYGRTLAENMDTWLRTGDANETLVEVPASELASIEAVVREMEIYFGQLQASIIADGLSKASPTSQVQSEDSSMVRRRELARDWPTAAQVSRQLGSTAVNASHRANQLRRDGQLLGVWLPSEQEYRFPTWQFAGDGQPQPVLAELLALLRGAGGMGTENRQTSGWGEVEWFMTPHALLDGATPEELITSEPERVLAVAKEEFGESADASW
ncbi:hypothetical protein H4W19_04300 [Pseudoxanthomonas mexicana]|uniref:Uncharacterized protein n=1 Tax=Pseudoxanthomonas mexicana TaxID=128785 RepID=A0ABX6RCM6_PSEMX|nr:hypothetical protein [Pseudoxanthomonas mexicana]QND81018.1 hypothetical protein H4W19_04300 [Pseudoxanthomonas mexicana]